MIEVEYIVIYSLLLYWLMNTKDTMALDIFQKMDIIIQNYGSSSYSVIEIEYTFLTNRFLAIKKIVSR
jgi:hypothetical protein